MAEASSDAQALSDTIRQRDPSYAACAVRFANCLDLSTKTENQIFKEIF